MAHLDIATAVGYHAVVAPCVATTFTWEIDLAHSKSAKKRHRQSLVRAERNLVHRSTARSAVRAAREAITDGDNDAAAAAVKHATMILDRTASKGVIHANNAARRKSRLVKQLHAMGGGSASSES